MVTNNYESSIMLNDKCAKKKGQLELDNRNLLGCHKLINHKILLNLMF